MGRAMAKIDPEEIEKLILGFNPARHERLRDVLVEVFERLPQEEAEILIEDGKVRFIPAAWSQAIHSPDSQKGDFFLLVLPSSSQMYVVTQSGEVLRGRVK